jgi:hypothetical protein
MKKLLVVLMVLGMASMANAMLQISVNGQLDVPDTEIVLLASQTAMIDIHSDGLPVGPPAAADLGTFLTIAGPGTLDITAATNVLWPPGAPDSVFWWNETDVFMDLTQVIVPPPPIPQGVMVDNMILHCEAPGDVILTLWGQDSVRGMELYDTQIIHQLIPEPITVALLGLGGLFLRRRK